MNYPLFLAIFACLLSCELFSTDHQAAPPCSSESAGASAQELSECEELLRPYRDADAIDDSFLKDYEGKRLDLSSLTRVKTIPRFFLTHMNELQTFVFPPNVEDIEWNVLEQCIKLVSVDFSGLNKLRTISSVFLYGCTSLTSVDLSELVNLTRVGSFFLGNCTSLTSVNLSGLVNVKELPHGFLSKCTSLTSVDLSGLSVTKVDPFFLGSCTSLTSVNLSGLVNVTELSRGFLSKCTSLPSIDISMLKKLKGINSCILYEGTLKEIKIPSGNSVVINTLNFCPIIEKIIYQIDVSPDGTILYPDLTHRKQHINEFILPKLTRLEAIKLNQFQRAITLWKNFLRSCRFIVELNIDPLSDVETVDDGFLANCESLKTLKI
ncbi:MAG: hypothetical protein CNLJKLNK_01001 [Holosporales bacterium]